jgi:hypothetical protein
LRLKWPKSANVLLHWKNAACYVARAAKRGKKAILAHKDQKEKEAIRVVKVRPAFKAREDYPAPRASQVLRAKEAKPGYKASRDQPGLRAIRRIRGGCNNLRPASQNWRSVSLRRVNDLQSSRIPLAAKAMQRVSIGTGERRAFSLSLMRSMNFSTLTPLPSLRHYFSVEQGRYIADAKRIFFLSYISKI